MNRKLLMKWSCAGGVLALLVATIGAAGSIESAVGHRADADRGQSQAAPAQSQADTLQPGANLRTVSGGGMGACCISSRVPCASDADCVAAGFDEATARRVEHLIYISEYKRFQSAPGTRLTNRAFWLDRRYPIVNRWRDNG